MHFMPPRIAECCPFEFALHAGGQCVACTAPQSIPVFAANGLQAYVTLDYVKVVKPQVR